MKRPGILLVTLILVFYLTGVAGAVSVYLMSCGTTRSYWPPTTTDPLDNKIKEELEGFGHTVTIGVPYRQFDGTQSLAGYDVVLMMANYDYGSSMPADGQTALVAFITNGGGLITGEFAVWNVNYNTYNTLNPVFPTLSPGPTYLTSSSSTTYTENITDQLINKNLPDSFSFSLSNISGTEASLQAKSGAIVFYTSSNFTSPNNVGLAGWSYGSGRVANFSNLIGMDQMNDENFQQLLSNTVDWAAVPIPGAVLLFGTGLLGLGLLGWRRKKS